jgi:hypothetical protein
MVKKIEDKIIMTSIEARRKYEKYYIGFVSIEQRMADPDNERGYVAYLADTEDEAYEAIPRFTEEGIYIGIEPGHAVGGIRLGGFYFD